MHRTLLRAARRPPPPLRPLHPATSTLTHPRPASTSTSTMAAAATTPAKHEWLVILPDQPGALQRRLAVRADHLRNIQPAVASGLWKLGGAFFERPLVEGQDPAFAGSVMLAEAGSRDEVLEALRRDVYSTGDVWDWDKVQVLPFKSAFRVAT